MEQGVTMAWLNAYYQRTDNFPSLKEALKSLEPDTGMTNDEMLQMAKELNAKFNGKVEGTETGE